MSQTSDASNRTLTLERTIAAPKSLVWDAWTKAEHVEAWYGKPGQTTVKELDFKVGGKWLYVMAMPNGPEFTFDGVFQEIIDQEKVVSSANFPPMSTALTLIFEVEEIDGATKLTFSVVHETEEYCKQQEEMGVMKGWGGGFAGMDKYVTGLIA